MAHLIDKSALVAEIERRRDICKKVVLDLRTKEYKDYYQGKVEAYKETLSFINTLEVKEVGLDLGSPDGDMGVKTIWDGEKIVSSKAQKG